MRTFKTLICISLIFISFPFFSQQPIEGVVQFRIIDSTDIPTVVKSENPFLNLTFGVQEVQQLFDSFDVVQFEQVFPRVLEVSHEYAESLSRVYIVEIDQHADSLIYQLNNLVYPFCDEISLVFENEPLCDPFPFDDPEISVDLWRYNAINICDAWTLATGACVNIGIPDNFSSFTHDDYTNNIIYTNGNLIPGDTHGNSIAGIICAQPDNDEGIAGLAYNSNILLHSEYSLNTVLKLALEGADVINMSFIATGNQETNRKLITLITEGLNTILVSAARNNVGGASQDPMATWGGYDNVIQVSAVVSDGGSGVKVALNWQHDETVDILVPGVGIRTTLSGSGYATLNGNSFGAPQAVGVIALMREVYPEMPWYDAERILIESAQDITSTTDYFLEYEANGHQPGLLDANAAVIQAKNEFEAADEGFITLPLGTTTWTNETKIVDGIRIPSLSRLILENSRIFVKEGGKIIIEPNALLHTTTSILTSTRTSGCRGEWEGIEVSGDYEPGENPTVDPGLFANIPNSPLLSTGHSGYCIILEESKIENAKIGVRTYEESNPGGPLSSQELGGILYIRDSKILNSYQSAITNKNIQIFNTPQVILINSTIQNNPGIEPIPVGIWNDKSWIELNKTTIDDCFNGIFSKNGIVDLTDRCEIRASNYGISSTFDKLTIKQENLIENAFSGIRSFESVLDIYDGNIIQNCDRGIDHYALGLSLERSHLGRISSSLPNYFNQNSEVHVNLTNIAYANRFNIENNIFSSGSIGVYIDGQGLFSASGNKFSQTSNTGLAIRNTFLNNSADCNDFEDVNLHSLIAFGSNADPNTLNSRGFAFRYNEYYGSNRSIADNVIFGPIRAQVGAPNHPAENCFQDDASIPNIISTGSTPSFQYFFSNDINSLPCYEPEVYGNIASIGVASEGVACQDFDDLSRQRLGEGPFTKGDLIQIQAQIKELRNAYQLNPSIDSTKSQLVEKYSDNDYMIRMIVNDHVEQNNLLALDNILSSDTSYFTKRLRLSLKIRLADYSGARSLIDSLPSSSTDEEDYNSILHHWINAVEFGASSITLQDSIGIFDIAFSDNSSRSYGRALANNLYQNIFTLDIPNYTSESVSNGTQYIRPNTGHYKIFPNPATEFINIFCLTSQNTPTHVKVISSDGIEIINKKYNQQNISISTQSLVPGTYFIVLSHGQKTITKSIVIM